MEYPFKTIIPNQFHLKSKQKYFKNMANLATICKSNNVKDSLMKNYVSSNMRVSSCVERLVNGIRCSAIFLLLAASGFPGPAFAEGEESEMQAVFVVSSKDPDWKPYKSFLAGMNIFDEKIKLAPDASLRFVLRPRIANASVIGVTMNIETNDGNRIKVPVAVDGTFILPRSEEAARNSGEILLSKKRNTLSWRPAIHSPGVPQDARRLGDLRLECFVRWTIEQADLLAFFRATINAFGGPCTSSAIKVDYISDRPLSAVYLQIGTRRERLPGKWIEENGHIYLPPIHDNSWPDDTLLYFNYADSNGQ